MGKSSSVLFGSRLISCSINASGRRTKRMKSRLPFACLPFNVACRRTLQATICAAACRPVAVICCWCKGGGADEHVPFVVVVSKQSVVVDCCFDMGSLEMKVPFRKRITSRGIDFIRRRVVERVDEVIDDFNISVSLLLVELKPSVVVFESIRVASSAMITTLALGSRNESRVERTVRRRRTDRHPWH